jgi:hypothetical protein
MSTAALQIPAATPEDFDGLSPVQRKVVAIAMGYPCFGTSQIRRDLGGLTSPQVAPILTGLVRKGILKRVNPHGNGVYGPNGWEQAWAVRKEARDEWNRRGGR